MAYDKKKVFEQAKEAVLKHKLFFIEDIVAFLPINKSTYYEFYPIGSDESNELKEMLDTNRVEIKSAMRSKWYKSENATLQMGLMKLICTDEERRMLSMSHSDITINEAEAKRISGFFPEESELNGEGDKS